MRRLVQTIESRCNALVSEESRGAKKCRPERRTAPADFVYYLREEIDGRVGFSRRVTTPRRNASQRQESISSSIGASASQSTHSTDGWVAILRTAATLPLIN